MLFLVKLDPKFQYFEFKIIICSPNIAKQLKCEIFSYNFAIYKKYYGNF